MAKDFIRFMREVNKETVRSREFWKEKDKSNTLVDFTLILQSQVGQLAESLLGKGNKDPTTEIIHTAAMAYMVYLKLK